MVIIGTYHTHDNIKELNIVIPTNETLNIVPSLNNPTTELATNM